MEKTRARDGDGSGWSANTANAYKTAYEYDANGNLLNLARNIYDNGVNDVEMDNLDYNYDVFTGTNKLLSVADQTKILDPANTTDGNHDDITGTHTYTYDEIGNLTSDIDGTLSGISNIEWTIFGKIAKVEHVPGSTLPDLAFTYDAAGNRVKKEQVFPNPDNNITTYYVRDAQGIVMAIYERTFNTQPVTPLAIVKIIEQPIYGSSRLGSYAGNNVVGTVQYVAGTGKAHSPIRYENTTDVLFDRRVAQKSYELTDHLGNIRATITDYVEPNATFASFAAQVQTVSDYYAYGSLMPGRKYSPESYRFGFNGKEMDNDVTGVTGVTYDYGFRIYDARIGRFLSIDPLSPDYPELTPFQFASNSPIVNIDLDGLEAIMVHGTWSDPQTWNTVFSNNMLKATNWSSVQKEMVYATWSGSNSSGAREKAADELYNWIVSDANIFRDKKHVTLIGHSHGGNVDKIVKNKLEKEGWKVDIINIETPQRDDTQSDETGNGIYLNFYSDADLIQFLGTGSNESSEGSRVDSKANENIELNTYVKQPGLQKLKKTVFAPVVYFGETLSNALSWLITQGAGHSLQQQKQSQNQIINKTERTFKDQNP